MKGRGSAGILEVLVVNAQGIRHTNFFGTPAYYVIAQCGTQEHRSKISKVKDEKAWWNEKFIFEFPESDWKHLSRIKFTIMDTEFFSADGGFVGETTFYLGGIVGEGNDRGEFEVKPEPFSVLLEDDTYKGQIMLGFKFTTRKQETHIITERGRDFAAEEGNNVGRRSSTCRWILSNLWKMSWFKFLLRPAKIISKET